MIGLTPPRQAAVRLTRAEALALALLSLLIIPVVLPYAADALGLGVVPRTAAVSSLLAALAIGVIAGRASSPARAETALIVTTILLTLGVAGWLAWPSLLPPGGGPDLTHHLLLVDFIERHGALVHDPQAVASMGEMAQYTPGLHLLAVLGGAVSRTSGFAAMFPVVALSVALKFGFAALCALRLLPHSPARVPLAAGGIGLAFYAGEYTLGAFIHDSFLAQVVAELFAMAMWWAIIAWDQAPSVWSMLVFAACGVAAFLTWPLWIGPPMVALGLVIGFRTTEAWTQRLLHLAIAVTPIAAVAAVHLTGRTEGLGLLGTSGAVSLPPWSMIGWWLPALAAAGLLSSARTPAVRPLLAFAAALALQTAALWLVARRAGATTPYMAIKMLYLAIYPLIAAALVAVARVVSNRGLGLAVATALILAGGAHVATMPRPTPTVAHDLRRAGQWAREHVPTHCVDYLVNNEYTAYWLHLAVLGNPRNAARSTDNATYATQPSFARWLVDNAGAPYAIARWSVLPVEIRDRVKVLHRTGDAAVITRPGECR